MKIHIRILLAVFLSLALLSCGGSNPNNATGSISFSLLFEAPSNITKPGIEKTSFAPAPDICVDYGITTITLRVQNSSGGTVASQNFTCSLHTGTLPGIPVGSGYTLIAEGLIGATTAWSGSKPSLSVNANQVTPAGGVSLNYQGSDSNAPSVLTRNPNASATNVPVTTPVTVTFSEDMAISSINESTFTLMQGATPVTGVVTYNAANKTATLAPSAVLAYSTLYTATVTTGMTDMAKRSLTPSTWSFTTETPTGTAPSAPTGLTATPGNAQVSLTWNASAGATSYTAYWGTSPGVTKSSPNKFTSLSSSATHTNLANGTTYYYAVSSNNGIGESAGLSNEASATPAVPTYTVGGNVAGLTGGFLDLRLNGGSVLSISTSTTFIFGSQPLTSGATYSVTIATQPTGLTCTVINGSGSITNANITSIFVNCGALPAAPASLDVTKAFNGSATLSWPTVTGATSYNLYWSQTSPAHSTGTKISGVSSPHQLSGLPNTFVYFVVTAVNTYGEGPDSPTASAFVIADLAGPQLLGGTSFVNSLIAASSGGVLTLEFSEKLDVVSAQTVSNYRIHSTAFSDTAPVITSATYDDANSRVHLFLSTFNLANVKRSFIDSGNNGICESTAAAGDGQIMPLGSGWICVYPAGGADPNGTVLETIPSPFDVLFKSASFPSTMANAIWAGNDGSCESNATLNDTGITYGPAPTKMTCISAETYTNGVINSSAADFILDTRVPALAGDDTPMTYLLISIGPGLTDLAGNPINGEFGAIGTDGTVYWSAY